MGFHLRQKAHWMGTENAKARRVRRSGSLRLLAVLCVCAVSFLVLGPRSNPADGQAPRPKELPTFRVQSNLVVVDVTVRDRKGNPIRDLKRSDFKILEDNVPQEIVTFSAESIPVTREETVEANEPKPKAAAINFGVTPAAEIKKEDVQDKRLIILYFDLSSLSAEPEDVVRAVSTAEEFVRAEQLESAPPTLIALLPASMSLIRPSISMTNVTLSENPRSSFSVP